MTTTAQIIADAYRQGNILAVTATPTTAQQTEALRYLNRIVKSVFGNEAGENFLTLPIGRVNIQRPTGFPWYDNVPDGDWFIPENTRLICNINAPITLYMHPSPDDGSRLAVSDVAGNFATNNVTLEGNGRRIENATSLVLSANGTNTEWFFRADLSNWMKYAPLVALDTFPFPEEFDDFFITMLALRLNPAYGRTLDPQSQMVFNRSKTQIRARYTQNIAQRSELALIRPSKSTQDRWLWSGDWSTYDPSSLFNKGWPF